MDNNSHFEDMSNLIDPLLESTKNLIQMLKDRKSNIYEGDNINIEEMPQGCIVSSVGDSYQHVRISSTGDALALIDSLQRMIAVQKGE